jgi:GTP-binding protein
VEARLTHSAGGPAEFPRDRLAEIAVLGRSNVGKSSFINALLGRRSLARTSARPGKTRRIHFYRVGEAFYLVDMPGYGWAAVARSERRSWRRLAEAYLRGARRELRGAILLVDVRRGLEEEEHQLLEWLAHERIPAALAFTKSDKLAASRLKVRLGSLAEQVGLPAERVCAVSSRSGAGLAEVAHWVHDWTGTVLRRPDGSPLRPS